MVVLNSAGGVPLTLPAAFPSALEFQLELLLAESVQGAPWCQAPGVTACCVTSACREGGGGGGRKSKRSLNIKSK